MYFKQFPKIYYPFNVNGEDKLIVVKDITLNVRVIKEILNTITLYDAYWMEDGDTLDIVAEKVYGNPQLHWTIMLANNRYDYIKDYPLSDAGLETLILEKYGTGHRNDIHMLHGREHWIDADKIIVDRPTDIYSSSCIAVTNYDYESGLNEAKRLIRLISPSMINTFVTDIQDSFSKNV
jgi:hypothetical protein